MYKYIIYPLLVLSIQVFVLYSVAKLTTVDLDRLQIAENTRYPFLRYYRISLLVAAILSALVVQRHIVPRDVAVTFITAGPFSSEAAVIVNGLSLGLLMTLSVFVVEGGLRPELTDLYAHRDLIDQRSRRRKRVAAAGVLLWSGLLLEAIFAGRINIAAGLYAGIAGNRIYRHFDLQATVPGETARRPEPAERNRIESWYDKFGSFPDNIVVYSGDSSGKSVIASGRDSTRLLGIHEDILAELDDESLGVVLAQAEAKRRAHFWSRSTVTDTVALGIVASILAVLVAPGSLWSTDILPPYSVSNGLRMTVVVIFLIGILYAGSWMGRRSTFQADDEVVSQFGAERVINAYQQTGDLYFIESVGGLPGGKYTREPSTERRIKRLRGKHSI